MLLLILVEGDTEDKVLAGFLARWLNSRLKENVVIKTINFKGYANYYKEAAQKAIMHLNSPRGEALVAVVGLLDLYGPNFFPANVCSVDEKYWWAKVHMEQKVDSKKFKQHFAVHELEAWLLSDPSIFSDVISKGVKEVTDAPELVNSEQPPAKLLNSLYMEEFHRTYKKVTEGYRLFQKLDPEIVRNKCPYFKIFTDELYDLAVNYIKSASL